VASASPYIVDMIVAAGDAIAMCHRLCGYSTYGLKAHVREMSTCLSSPLGIALL